MKSLVILQSFVLESVMMNILVKSGVSPRIFLLLMGLFVTCTAKIFNSIETVMTSKELDARGLECVYFCLAGAKNSNNKIDECYDNCSMLAIASKEDERLRMNRLLMREYNTYDIGLVCRDDTTLIVMTDIAKPRYPDSMVIQFTVSDGTHKITFLATSPVGYIYFVKPGTSYNVTGFGYKGDMYFINEEFHLNGISTATLKSNSQVQNPKNITVSKYQISGHCKSCFYADVQWTPSEDHTCFYAISWHDNVMGDLQEVPFFVDFEVRPYYHFPIGNLEFGREYKIAIRSFMHSTEEPKNDFDWQTFVTPQCWEILTKHEDILEVCAPLQPTHVEAKDKRIEKEKYDITISWEKPQLPLPHHYTVTIRNLDHKAPFSIVMDVEGDKTEAEFKGLKITGLIYEATVEAAFASGKRSSTTIERRFTANDESTSLGTMTLYIVLAIVITLGVVSVVVWRFLIEDSKIQVQMLQAERNGSPRIEMRRYRTVEEDEAAKDTPYIDDEFEIDREKVTVLQEIGHGHFGTVYKGILENEYVEMAVAVKKLTKTPTSEDIRKFILEINIMKSVPKHRNIVSILGHCTSQKDTMLLITEYCSQGSLLHYLRCEWRAHNSQQARWSEFSDNFVNVKDIGENDKKINISLTSETGDFCSVHINAVENPTYSEDCADDFVMVDETHLTVKSLLDIALQVAEGMKFLALNKVVHRDLAARNILVNHENIVKIADFGLSRDIYEDGLYTKQGNGRLPIKWMALEALSRQVYSTESDVWSFGVLLYEIITLGCIPYPTIENDQLLVYLMSGSRMEKPSNCTDTLYELMMSCWLENPNLRPTFEFIIKQLTDEKDNLVDNEVVDLAKLDKDKNLRRDSFESYLTPICGRPPYMRLRGSPGFVTHSPNKYNL